MKKTLSFLQQVGLVAVPNLVATLPKVCFQKRGGRSKITKGREEKSREESGDYCLEINGGVRSCDGFVNSNKSPVLMFVLMAAESDLRRVKVRANCPESQCF